MSLTNICSCALIKDHKMRQIINDLYLLFLRIMNLAYIFLRTNILIYFLRIWDCTPSPPPPPPPLYINCDKLLLHWMGGGHWNNWDLRRSNEEFKASILPWRLHLNGVVYIPLLDFFSWHESKIFRIHCSFLFFKWCHFLYPFINVGH